MILLVAPMSISILLINEKIIKRILLLFFFSLPLIITLTPYIFLLFNLKTISGPTSIGLNLNLFSIYFKNLVLLLGPICFFSFLFFYFEKINKNFSCKILMIFIVFHFIIFIFWDLLAITFIRNYLYISYLYLILSSVGIIYLIELINYSDKKKVLKKILFLFLTTNFIYNIYIISNNDNLRSKNFIFYQTYFYKNNLIPQINKKIFSYLNNYNNEYYLFYNSQNTANYTLIFNKKIYKNVIYTKPIQSHYNLNFFIEKYKNIPESINSIFIISIVETANQNEIFYMLDTIKENFFIKKNCNIIYTNIIADEFILLGKRNIYFFDKIKCEKK